MRLREAHGGDAPELAGFCCAPTRDDWALAVEGAVREALQWRRRRPYEDRRVEVVELDGDILAVAVHRLIFAGSPLFGRHLEVLAVRLDLHREGIGESLMNAVLTRMAGTAPGGVVTWFVHESNTASIGLSDKIGAAREAVAPPAAWLSGAGHPVA